MKKMNFIKKENKKFALLSMLFLVLSCSNKTGNNSESTNSTTEQQKTVSPEELKKYTKNAAQTQDAFVGVHNSVKDSIVNIRTKKTVTVNTYNPLEELLYGRSGGQEKRESGSLGSGFVVSKDGYVVTNNHVIDGADEIYVKFSNGREYRTKLVGTSPEVDIAVLKVDSNETFKPLEFANSDQVQIGQWSIAFGNPLGLNDSMTVGIVSAAGRSSLGIEEIENFIQTDASINRGNSGGALINSAGELVGISTLSIGKTANEIAEGLNFAIPISIANDVLYKIIRDGRVIRGYFGVQSEISSNSNGGIVITGVTANSPAAKAGIQVGDVILRLNKQDNLSIREMMQIISDTKPNTEVIVTISRLGKMIDLPVIIEEFPSN